MDRACCCFIPPYLLRRLAEADAPDVAGPSRTTLLVDDAVRQRRRERPPVRATSGDRFAIHDAHNTEDLPGPIVRGDGDPVSGDGVVDDAYDSAAATYDLYATVLRRRSVDDRGTPVVVTVHYSRDYVNAFWDGEQLVFGDGDGVVFGPFTKPVDVLAHEFTHGVTQFAAGLAYEGQSGALNESVSDVFAAQVKQRVAGERAEDADWLVGEGIFATGVNGRALRSMTEPGTAYDDPRLGKDPQVGSMADYVDTNDDNGGVHINSGIPNRAFALAALAIGGNSWEAAGHVWYDALTGKRVGPNTDFAGFAAATVAAAVDRFGDATRETVAVRDAWTTVGVTIGPTAGVGGTGTSSSVAGTGGPGISQVEVRRTGGFAGLTQSATMDIGSDPAGPEVAALLASVDYTAFSAAPAPTGADRFTYIVQVDADRFELPEQALTPELHQVFRLVLGPDL